MIRYCRLRVAVAAGLAVGGAAPGRGFAQPGYRPADPEIVSFEAQPASVVAEAPTMLTLRAVVQDPQRRVVSVRVQRLASAGGPVIGEVGTMSPAPNEAGQSAYTLNVAVHEAGPGRLVYRVEAIAMRPPIPPPRPEPGSFGPGIGGVSIGPRPPLSVGPQGGQDPGGGRVPIRPAPIEAGPPHGVAIPRTFVPAPAQPSPIR